MIKNKFYSLENILKSDAQYNVIFGERSNGKTYACLEYALKQYVSKGKQSAYLRRLDEDFKSNRGATLYSNHTSNGLVAKLTKNKFTDIYYQNKKWWLCSYDEEHDNKRVLDVKPFCYAFSLTGMEHDKSTAYPDVTTIIFDEFITRGYYLIDEFVVFINVISTIVRQRTDVKIFMLGNTVNKYCPYFAEMGLKNVPSMEQGTIDLYTYGDSDLKVAVEYVGTNKSKKPSDVYFAFDNPKLKMITNGVWEVDLYPHCPTKYNPKNIIFMYFILFDNNILQCDIILKDDLYFTFIHRKTTPIKNPDRDLIFTTEYNPKPNYRRRINKPKNPVENKIYNFFKNDDVYYQDNETGEIVRNYLMWCNKN